MDDLVAVRVTLASGASRYFVTRGREPYFFEALFSFAQDRIPFGDGYEEWRATTDREMRKGKHLYFLGTP